MRGMDSTRGQSFKVEATHTSSSTSELTKRTYQNLKKAISKHNFSKWWSPESSGQWSGKYQRLGLQLINLHRSVRSFFLLPFPLGNKQSYREQRVIGIQGWILETRINRTSKGEWWQESNVVIIFSQYQSKITQKINKP